MERRRILLNKIKIVVFFTNEITNKDLDFLDELVKDIGLIHRVFIVTDVSDEEWNAYLSNAIGMRIERIDIGMFKRELGDEFEKINKEEVAVANPILMLTMRGHPERFVYLHPGPNVERFGLDLEKVKEFLETDKDVHAEVR